jgi:hypothetical protein
MEHNFLFPVKNNWTSSGSRQQFTAKTNQSVLKWTAIKATQHKSCLNQDHRRKREVDSTYRINRLQEAVLKRQSKAVERQSVELNG